MSADQPTFMRRKICVELLIVLGIAMLLCFVLDRIAYYGMIVYPGALFIISVMFPIKFRNRGVLYVFLLTFGMLIAGGFYRGDSKISDFLNLWSMVFLCLIPTLLSSGIFFLSKCRCRTRRCWQSATR